MKIEVVKMLNISVDEEEYALLIAGLDLLESYTHIGYAAQQKAAQMRDEIRSAACDMNGGSR